MKYLLDTNIIIDHLRNKRLISVEKDADFAISLITYGELMVGVYKSSSREKSLLGIEKTISLLSIEIISLNQKIMEEFASIKLEFNKKGVKLEDFDILIAATAKVYDIPLLTHNKKHFARIKGVQLL